MFNNWLKETSKLSDSSVYKYSHAVNTISREMMERKVIAKPLKDMELFEIDLAISLIFCTFIISFLLLTLGLIFSSFF